MENDELLKLLRTINRSATHCMVEQAQTPMEKRAHELAADLKAEEVAA